MAFKMKGYSGNHGKSPIKKTYKEAYKDADKSKYKTFESFKAAAERYNEDKYGTTQPTAKAKKYGMAKSETVLGKAKVAAKKPATVSKPKAAKMPTKTEVSKKQVSKIKAADIKREASAKRVKDSVSSGLTVSRAKAKEERQAKRAGKKAKKYYLKQKLKN
tara:strand:- start:6 stop:488 length:483 start_codon:yes stop_codon:yes gene_type:complete